METNSDLSTKYERYKKTYFEAGTSFKAIVPFSLDPMKVHIDHVFPSVYEGRQLIVYRVYGKHKQWWHEFMCTNVDMCYYIDEGTGN